MTEFEQYYLNSTPAHWNIESLSAIAEAMPSNGPFVSRDTALNYEKDIFPVVLVSAGQLHLNALYCYAVNPPYFYGSVIFNHMEVVAEYLIQKSAELELSDQFSPRIAYLMASANEFNSKTQEKNYWLKRVDDFSRGNAFMRLNSTFINCGMKI
jgi:hypothetical protein